MRAKILFSIITIGVLFAAHGQSLNSNAKDLQYLNNHTWKSIQRRAVQEYGADKISVYHEINGQSDAFMEIGDILQDPMFDSDLLRASSINFIEQDEDGHSYGDFAGWVSYYRELYKIKYGVEPN